VSKSKESASWPTSRTFSAKKPTGWPSARCAGRSAIGTPEGRADRPHRATGMVARTGHVRRRDRRRSRITMSSPRLSSTTSKTNGRWWHRPAETTLTLSCRGRTVDGVQSAFASEFRGLSQPCVEAEARPQPSRQVQPLPLTSSRTPLKSSGTIRCLQGLRPRHHDSSTPSVRAARAVRAL
jgi:hypothetical protein